MYKMKKCCICNDLVEYERQYNPDPVDYTQGAICCVDCFFAIVLPARIAIRELMFNGTAGYSEKRGNTTVCHRYKTDTIHLPDFSEAAEAAKKTRRIPFCEMDEEQKKERLESGKPIYGI